MDQDLETEKPGFKIVSPNLDNLNPWLKRYVKEPFRSYKDLTHPDGRPFSREEQIEATKDQLRMHVQGWKAIGGPKEKLIQDLIEAVKPYSEEGSNAKHK